MFYRSDPAYNHTQFYAKSFLMCHLSSNATGGCLKLINSNLHVMKVNKLQIKVNLELFNFSERKIEVAIVLVNLLTDLKRMNFSIFSFKQTGLVLVFLDLKRSTI